LRIVLQEAREGRDRVTVLELASGQDRGAEQPGLGLRLEPAANRAQQIVLVRSREVADRARDRAQDQRVALGERSEQRGEQ
jgi:hypothetical protein